MEALVTPQTVTQLRKLLQETARYVPFYRRLWERADIDVTELHLPRDLNRLPVIRKADLLACPPEARLDARFLGRRTVAESTSGSTGQPFDMRIDAHSLRRRRYRFLRALMGVGYFPGQRLMLISNPPNPRGAKWVRWIYADLRRGEADVFDAYRRTRPHVLYGPLSSLLLLAKRVVDAREPMPRPHAVVSTAEQLRAPHRALLTEAFGDCVADFYGMTELGLVAYSRPRDPAYRVLPGHLHLEFLPSSTSSPLERLIVTDLGGGVMPLIRFDTGDLVQRDHSRADAPIVQFSGREVDCLKRSDGGWVSPYEVTVALDQVPGIRQYQVAQRRDLTIDLYVAPVDASSSAAALDSACRVLRTVCGESVRVEVHTRAEQPLQPGRKQRTVLSLAAA
jgi:phenylacetate-CoA ligase